MSPPRQRDVSRSCFGKAQRSNHGGTAFGTTRRSEQNRSSLWSLAPPVGQDGTAPAAAAGRSCTGEQRRPPRLGSAQSRLRGIRSVVLLAGVLMTVGALVPGPRVLVPIAVAGLLTFVLNPIVRVFERRLPRAAAVVLVVALAFAVLGGFAWALAVQAASPGAGDSDLPGQSQAQGRPGPWSKPGQRDREGAVGHEGSRRRTGEGRQASQAGRQARFPWW